MRIVLIKEEEAKSIASILIKNDYYTKINARQQDLGNNSPTTEYEVEVMCMARSKSDELKTMLDGFGRELIEMKIPETDSKHYYKPPYREEKETKAQKLADELDRAKSESRHYEREVEKIKEKFDTLRIGMINSFSLVNSSYEDLDREL